MGEEFYSIIKLMSGEEVFSLISVDENNWAPVIILQNPLVMKIMESPKGSFIKVKKMGRIIWRRYVCYKLW